MAWSRPLIFVLFVFVLYACQYHPFFDDELPDYECPYQCNGGCNETKCIIIGDGSNKPIVCPPGRLCQVDCIEVDTTDNTCKAEIDCSQASECVINCKEGGSCRGLITCGEGPCEVDCSSGACASGIDCSQSSSCRILCSSSCEGSIVCGKECGPCRQGYVCASGYCVLDGVDFCPLGQECIEIGGDGLLGCVIPPNTIPPGNQTDCSQTPCMGNFSCHCLDADCSQSICIENCGSCPVGTECCELWADGPWGCLTYGCGDIPPNRPYCDQNTPCQGNASCFTDGTNNFCIDMCSTNAGSCVEGERICDGAVVLECVNGGWVDRVDCSNTQRLCIDGGCHTPYGLGEFCDNGVCASGLDCLPDPAGGRSFCTQLCNCGTEWFCDDGWECRLTNQPDNPTTCWCAKMCPHRDPFVDCPNGGVDWDCVVAGQDPEGNDEYICLPGW